MARLASPRFRLAALAVFVGGASLLTAVTGLVSTDDVERWVRDSGPVGPLAFVAIYALLTVALVPGTLASLAAGALFGPVPGTALTVIGATIGATGSFVVGRRLGRAQVQRLTGDRARGVDGWIAGHGLRAVLVLRLAPIVPFNVANVALGTTSVSLRDYVAGTAIGIVPGSAAYVALGSSVTEPGSTEFVLSVTALLVLTALAWAAGRRRERGVRAS